MARSGAELREPLRACNINEMMPLVGLERRKRVNKTLPGVNTEAPASRTKLDWRKRMSDNVAYALLVYTGLQIFVTMTALKAGHGGTILPYFALIFLVAAIIPGARWFEARWSGLSDIAASNPEFADSFRRDCVALWLCAIGLPFGLTALYKGVAALF